MDLLLIVSIDSQAALWFLNMQVTLFFQGWVFYYVNS